MQDQNTNNNFNLGDDPYTNDNIYPVYAIVTCSFFDSYIHAKLNDFDHSCLSGNPKKGIKNVYMRDVKSELDKLLKTVGNRIIEISNWFNNDNMKELRSFYEDYKAKFTEASNKKIARLLGTTEDTIDQKFNSMPDTIKVMNKQVMKNGFLITMENYYRDSIYDIIDRFNNDKYKSINLFINTCNLIAANKQFGLIPNEDHDINPAEAQYLSSYCMGSFADYKEKTGLDTKYIYLVYAHLLVNIKNRPFMMIQSLNKDTAEYYNKLMPNSLVDNKAIIPSIVVVCTLHNESLDNYYPPDDFSDDDYYDDDDEDDL